MEKRLIEFDQEVTKLLNECSRFAYMSRGRELQIEACAQLQKYIDQAQLLKQEAIQAQQELVANGVLYYEALLKMLFYELQMWIALKDDNPNVAWDYLIDAQNSLRTALLSQPQLAENYESTVNRLDHLERLLFPKPVFVSTGLVVNRVDCSICGQEYGSCNHINGRAYMGQLCAEVISEIAGVREVSIVEHPADKKCRMYSFADGDIKRDFMSWRAISSTEEHDSDRKELNFEARALTFTQNTDPLPPLGKIFKDSQ